MGRREGIWAGKISGQQQAAKGISFQKRSAVSSHKAKIKDTPLKYSERKSVLGRKGRGKGWEQLERNSSGTDRQAVTKSVNYLKNKLTQKRTSWGGGGGRTSGYPSIMHKPAQGHCEKGSSGHHHGNVTRSWPVTQHGTLVTLCYPWLVVFCNLSWYPQEETKEHKGLAAVCVSNCIATTFSPGTSGMGQPGASLLLSETVTTTNNWVLSRSQLHPGWCCQVKVSQATRQETQETNLSLSITFPDWSLHWYGASPPELQIPSFYQDQVTHTAPGDYTTWFFLAGQPPTLLAFGSFFFQELH